MARVVFLIRSLNQGGTERQLATLIPRLNRARFDVTVMTFYPGGVFRADLIAANVRVVDLNKSGRWDLIGFLWRLVRELRRIRPDVVHSYLVEPNLVAALIKPLLRARIVWGIRGADRDFSKYDWFVRMNFRLQALASRFADLVIFNSKAARDFHVNRGFKMREAMVIYPGIDIDQFKPDPESRTRIRQEWGIEPGAILIGVAGRLDPIKDHRTFLRAAGELSRREPNCRFVCVGQGPVEYAEGLRQLAEELGLSNLLIWAGARTDMAAVYNALDIACCSSISESMPNAIAEAMACDVPCVVTNVGDAATLVGNTGVVVPANNPQALAEGLMKCIDNARMDQRPSPRQRIIDEFGVDLLVDRTETALAALAQS